MEKLKEYSQLGRPYFTCITGIDDNDLETIGKVFLEVAEEVGSLDYVLVSTNKVIREIASQVFGWNGAYDSKGVGILSAVNNAGRLSHDSFWMKRVVNDVDYIPAVLDFIFVSGSNIYPKDIEYIKELDRFFVSKVNVTKVDPWQEEVATKLLERKLSSQNYVVWIGTRELDRRVKEQVRRIFVDMVASQYKQIKGVDFRDEHS